MKWFNLLSGEHFTIVTDQIPMAFMIDIHTRSNIGNNTMAVGVRKFLS